MCMATYRSWPAWRCRWLLNRLCQSYQGTVHFYVDVTVTILYILKIYI